MSGSLNPAWKDPVCELLAAFTRDAPTVLDGDLLADAKLVATDSVAVALGAFQHPAAQVARRYLELFPQDGDGALIWGTQRRASVDKATLVNGVLLRAYDFNDVLSGARSSGHPSDMVSALLVVSDWRKLSGMAFLSALALGYDVTQALYDTISTRTHGWDHATLTAIGATCAIGRLMNLSFEQQCEALSIAALQHFQSDEIESSILNRSGDLTMWKRFHGGDAMRHAVDACLLASVGAEGALQPFSGRLGFLAKFGVENDILPALIACLRPGHLTNALAGTNLKRWPVGSRAQSAILSALDARAQLPAEAQIARVEVEAAPGVYHHLVEIRVDPYRPTTRETADHSLPYIVGAAVLDGFVATKSFDPGVVVQTQRTAFVADKVFVTRSENLSGPDNLSLVRIVTQDGASFAGCVKPGPGHRNNRFRQSDVDEKLAECATPLIGAAGAEALRSALHGLDGFGNVRDLTLLMAAQG